MHHVKNKYAERSTQAQLLVSLHLEIKQIQKKSLLQPVFKKRSGEIHSQRPVEIYMNLLEP